MEEEDAAPSKGGGTRLDRLFLLLETGSSEVVRGAAARQIGELQAAYPHELQPLLARLGELLLAPAWEARTAAGAAIEEVCAGVEDWADEVARRRSEGGAKAAAAADAQQQRPERFRLRFEHLNVDEVIARGRPLLASGGEEFDVDWGNVRPEKRLEIQRRQLAKRLGLENEVTGRMGELVTPEDLIRPPPAAQQSPAAASANNAELFEGMSVRERSRAARKAKKKAREKKRRSGSMHAALAAAPGTPQAKMVAADGGDGSALVYEAVHADPVRDAAAWPFGTLCDRLLDDLFDPRWEARHGAAVGLLAVLRRHGAGAGLGEAKGAGDAEHVAWVNDCANRLLGVLILDQFADYVSDRAVAPVRESCAQVLGALMQYAEGGAVEQVVERLLGMARRRESWELRLSGFLGAKYTAAARADLLPRLAPVLLPALSTALLDRSDDVRGVAADSLRPLLAAVTADGADPRLLAAWRAHAATLEDNLWAVLGDLDDLTASTGSILDALAVVCTLPESLRPPGPAARLHARMASLLPFFSHAIASVRRSSLATLARLVRGAGIPDGAVRPAAVCVFQAVLARGGGDAGTLAAATDAWRALLVECPPERALLAAPALPAMIALAALPPGHSAEGWTDPAEAACKARAAADAGRSGVGGGKDSEKGSEREEDDDDNLSDLDVDDELGDAPPAAAAAAAVVAAAAAGSKRAGARTAAPAAKRRQTVRAGGAAEPAAAHEGSLDATLRACAALGELLRSWSRRPGGVLEASLSPGGATVLSLLVSLLGSEWAFRRQAGATVLCEWLGDGAAHPGGGVAAATELLDRRTGAGAEAEGLSRFAELVHLRSQVVARFCGLLRAMRVPADHALSVAAATWQRGEAPPPLADIEGWTGAQFEQWRAQCSGSEGMAGAAEEAVAIRDLLARSLAETRARHAELHRRTASAAAAASVAELAARKALPARLNPVIRSLMAAVKAEAGSAALQDRAASALASLVGLCHSLGRNPNPAPKLLRNVASLFVAPLPAEESDCGAPLRTVQARGGRAALVAMARRFGDRAFEVLPSLRARLAAALGGAGAAAVPSPAPTTAQLHSEVQVLAALVAPAGAALARTGLLEMLPAVCAATGCGHAAVRAEAARCVGEFCARLPDHSMVHVLRLVVPRAAAGGGGSDAERAGAVHVLRSLLADARLEAGLLPYLAFVVPPLLGRMSDPVAGVRTEAAAAFAGAVRLFPLEAGSPDPPGMPADLRARRPAERAFLERLLDGSKIEQVEPPAEVRATLRRYQREGVSWLAFLRRYSLHGILCDDMGLGKTLQTICVLAAAHKERRERARGGGGGGTPPSLVVCPSPLVAHWHHEIGKFVPPEVLRPVQYLPAPGQQASAARRGLVARVAAGELDDCVVVVPYDLVRREGAALAAARFHYCVLDEGHVIKNSKSALSRAVRSLSAENRLILSGTPVQNNVLELWTLFDFLMPGYLGAEDHFRRTCGRAIAAAARSHARSGAGRRPGDAAGADARTRQIQEEGALALERLHRQVLPFLLRRVKEDVLADLPPKIVQDYYCDLSPLQARIYDSFAKTGDATALGGARLGSSPGSAAALQSLMYLRKLCSHPRLVMTDQYPQNREAAYDVARSGGSLRDVEHAPKLAALEQILTDCGIGGGGGGGDSGSKKKKGKEEEEEEGVLASGAASRHRVLVFCQLKATLDVIQEDLLERRMPGATYSRLDGDTPSASRFEVVQQFNADPTIDMLLMTTGVGHLGLNLTGADTVVMFEHDWNPSKDDQAMARAHRIGQRNVVNVYRLIVRGTLEEQIMSLQQFKQHVADTVITKDNAALDTMETGQVMGLFEDASAVASAAAAAVSSSSSSAAADADGLDATGEVTAGAKRKKGAKKTGLSAELGRLSELHDEAQYSALNVDAFSESLKKRKKEGGGSKREEEEEEEEEEEKAEPQ